MCAAHTVVQPTCMAVLVGLRAVAAAYRVSHAGPAAARMSCTLCFCAVQVEGRVRAALDRESCELRPQWGGTLFHLEDLPFRCGCGEV